MFTLITEGIRALIWFVLSFITETCPVTEFGIVGEKIYELYCRVYLPLFIIYAVYQYHKMSKAKKEV